MFISVLFAADAVTVTSKTSVFPGQILQVSGTMEGPGTANSAVFTLGNYDDVNWTNFPFTYQFNNNSVAGSIQLKAWIQGSFDKTNWVTTDTLLTQWSTTEGIVNGTIDFGNSKYPYYRVGVEGGASNNADTTFDFRFWLYQE